MLFGRVSFPLGIQCTSQDSREDAFVALRTSLLSAKGGMFAKVGKNSCRLGTKVEDEVECKGKDEDEVEGEDEDEVEGEDKVKDEDEDEVEGKDKVKDKDEVKDEDGLLLVMVDQPKSSTTLCSLSQG